MENNHNDSIEASVLLTNFISSNKKFSYLLLALLFLLSFFVISVYLKTSFSTQAKDMSTASKQMAESLKASTETLVPIPAIVKGFSSLVDNRVTSEFLKKEAEFDKIINDKMTNFNTGLKKTTDDIDRNAIEIQEVMSEVKGIKAEADKTLGELRKRAKELSLLFPKVEKYKNVIDPEYLMRELRTFNNWSEGASIVVRMEDLVQSSRNTPAQLPAKYIELVGDWCREQNQSHLALEFYKESMKRDPDRISAKIEFYALQAEVIPAKRKESIKVLTEMALSGKLKMNRVRRIFNTLMELKKFSELASLTESLIKVERYKNNTASLATLYRNNAVALKEYSEYITDKSWDSIIKAVKHNPKDQNVLKIYSYWLLEKYKFSESIIQAKLLLKMSPNNTAYYLMLGEGLIGNENYESALKIYEYAFSIAANRNDKIRLMSAIRQLPSTDIDNIIEGARN